jgi:hypothetical protein
MALNIQNTNYNGDVLEQLLTLAVTGIDLVDNGLIRVVPQVSPKGFSIPRIKVGKMLQKRKEQPALDGTDSQGDFNYSERKLMPQEFMAYTEFNPHSFASIWRPFQPKGNLVFAELPPEIQNQLLDALSKEVHFELGDKFINGVYSANASDTDKLFNGIIVRMTSDNDAIKVTTAATKMLDKLAALKSAIPNVLRKNPNLQILMSINDFDTYDQELTALPNKGAQYSDLNVQRYKGIPIQRINNWPDGFLVATLCAQDNTSNLWAAVNLEDDWDVIQIDKVTNSGERYFFKMLMSADTQIAFGEQCIILDTRTVSAVEESITVEPNEVAIPTAGGSAAVLVVATSAYTVSGAPTGYTVTQKDEGVLITAPDNTKGTADIDTEITLTLTADNTNTAIIHVYQPKGA